MKNSKQDNRSAALRLNGIVGNVGGFKVQRMFPRDELHCVDPFLFLDFFDTTVPPNFPSGHNAHPHRGFETVSIIMEGDVGYRDSLGNRGVLKAGSVEWMTAGSGIVHDAHDDHDFAKQGGRILGLQLWVNLPSRLKMIEPRARYIPPEDIPVAQTPGVRARVIAGEAHGVVSPHETHVPILLVDYLLDANADVSIPIPSSWSSFVHVCTGSILLSDDASQVDSGQFVHLNSDAESISFSAGANGARLLLAAGAPIKEPVASWGPFVMNTREEIYKAQVDYQAGRMGSLPNE